MNIGQAAQASGLRQCRDRPGCSGRYYEAIGVIPKAGRTEGGYRVYSDADVNTLRFVRAPASMKLTGFPSVSTARPLQSRQARVEPPRPSGARRRRTRP